MAVTCAVSKLDGSVTVQSAMEFVAMDSLLATTNAMMRTQLMAMDAAPNVSLSQDGRVLAKNVSLHVVTV